MNAKIESPFQEPDFDWEAAYQEAEQIGDQRTTWAYDWPAGQRLAHDLRSSGQRFDNLSVCDLGCGRGQLGFAALQLGARSVYFCDHSSQILSYVAAKISHNHLTDRASVKQHRWGSRIPGAPFDVILGGDILYRPECFDQLITTIAQSLHPEGYAILSDPRTDLEPALYEHAMAHQLSADTKRHQTYTTVNFRYKK